MPRPRRRFWLVLLVGLTLAGGVWWWAATRAIWTADAWRIDKGMTEPEVVALLGKPADETAQSLTPDDDRPLRRWYAFDGYILVRFSAEGQVIGRAISDQGIAFQWKRFRRWCGW